MPGYIGIEKKQLILQRELQNEMLRIKSFICLILAFLPLCVCAQFQIPFLQYDVKRGLPDKAICDIVQDKKGFIWIATEYKGLVRFDSREFKNFTIADGLPSNTIMELYVDSRDRLWGVTMAHGLFCMRDGKFKIFNTENGLPLNDYFYSPPMVSAFAEDSRGRIYYKSANGGITLFDNDTIVRSYTEKDGLPLRAETFCLDEQDRMFVSCRCKQFFVVENDKVSEIKFPADAGALRIFRNDKREIFLLGERAQIYKLEGKNYTEIQPAWSNPPSEDFFGHQAKLIGDTVFFTIENGFYKRSISDKTHKIFTIIDPKTRAVDDNFDNMTITRDSAIWLTTYSALCVNRYKNGKLQSYATEQGLPSTVVNQILEDANRNIWFATEAGITMLGKDIFETINTKSAPQLNDNNVLAVCSDEKGIIYFATADNAIYELNPATDEIKNLYRASELNVSITCLHAFEGTLLVGTTNDLYQLKNRQLKMISTALSHTARDLNYVHKVCADGKDFYAVGAFGVLAYRNGEFTHYGEFKNITQEEYRDMLDCVKDQDGNFWVSTHGEGLLRFKNDTTMFFNKENTSPHLDVLGKMICDRENNLWITAPHALLKVRVNGDSFVCQALKRADGLHADNPDVRHYDENRNLLFLSYPDGFDIMNLSTGKVKFYSNLDGFGEQPAVAVAQDAFGRIYFATADGLVRYTPEKDVLSKEPPQLHIRLKLMSGKNYADYADSICQKTGLPYNLVLPYNQNHLHVEWVGVHYTIPEKNRYKYILEGFDKEWTVDSKDKARELQLYPGSYTLRIMAANNDGVYSEEVSFSFTIRPPWYRTIWAFILYAAGLLLLGYWVNHRRMQRLQKANIVLEEKVQERTMELQQANINLQEYQEELIQQRDFADQQKQEIERLYTETEDSIRYAKHIQTALMPKDEEMDELLDDYFLLFRPRDIVSGDYYWATKKDNKAVIIVADCTGHGVPGSLMSMVCISALNEIVNSRGIVSPAEILENTRANIKKLLGNDKDPESPQRDGMDACLIVIDFEKREMKFCGAYNPLFLYRNGELIEYKANRQPVGAYIAEKPFTEETILLEPNDMFYLFSDGYIDQNGGEKGQSLKSRKFKALLAEIHTLPCAEQKEILLERLHNWLNTPEQIYEQVDDISVMGIRIR